LTAARRDLQQIASYIRRESGSARTAARFVEGLVERCRDLASLPGVLGTARPELGAEIRSLPHRGYVIFFRYSGRHLEIVHVVEGHRDMGAVFAVDPEPRG
jgi:plasmid stabilization system protein ParE